MSVVPMKVKTLCALMHTWSFDWARFHSAVVAVQYLRQVAEGEPALEMGHWRAITVFKWRLAERGVHIGG